jgi:hypothetical protein
MGRRGEIRGIDARNVVISLFANWLIFNMFSGSGKDGEKAKHFPLLSISSQVWEGKNAKHFPLLSLSSQVWEIAGKWAIRRHRISGF